MSDGRLFRYPQSESFRSILDPIEDILNLITGLLSLNHLERRLIEVFQKRPEEVPQLAQEIAGYIRMGLQFYRQGMVAPPETSFLAYYYSVLNLSKVYILVKAGREELNKNRTHGVKYRRPSEFPSDILEDYVTLGDKGSLPLIIKCLCPERPVIKSQQIQIRDILARIPEVSHEFKVYCRSRSKVVPAEALLRSFSGKPEMSYRAEFRLVPEASGDMVDKNDLDDIFILKGLKREQIGADIIFTTENFASEEEAINALRALVPADFLFYPTSDTVGIPLGPQDLNFPEEIWKILLFFYLSSVVRYYPDALNRIMNSETWPVLLAARQHSSFKFLLNFWAFMERKTIQVVHNV